MNESRFPTIGPGNMKVCQECTEHLKHDVDHRIADELEKHPETLNGNDLLRDLLKLRRGQHGYESEMKCGEG
jgi:hypothetical protein